MTDMHFAVVPYELGSSRLLSQEQRQPAGMQLRFTSITVGNPYLNVRCVPLQGFQYRTLRIWNERLAGRFDLSPQVFAMIPFKDLVMEQVCRMMSKVNRVVPV